jgi:hypothetical protein
MLFALAAEAKPRGKLSATDATPLLGASAGAFFRVMMVRVIAAFVGNSGNSEHLCICG